MGAVSTAETATQTSVKPLELQILFTPENVDRILLPDPELPKIVTRRLIKQQYPGVGYPYCLPGSGKANWAFTSAEGRSHLIDWRKDTIHHRYGIGTHLYIQEATRVLELHETEAIVRYERDGAELFVPITPADRLKLLQRKDYARPCVARFMLKSFARYWVEVTDIDVQQLQHITPEDCLREGIRVFGGNTLDMPGSSKVTDAIYLDNWIRLWDSIHPVPGEFHWAKNPWVFVIAFRRIQKVQKID